MTKRRRGMPRGDWQTFDELLPSQRARCVCQEPLKPGGGVRVCPRCGNRLWVHAAVIVEIDRDTVRTRNQLDSDKS
jgi:hypothetical protein